ncbi:phospholipid-binding lipoprotein MlaA [Paucidesulfovibrio gracilis DSM 16080]|uniref:Phospholipid-binding lipoprotein MlaA n=1 Tax=Paucidesulfovibrio gracilis DSM 16080 TaxID=1121449 RepID=A0A1T4Y7F4_9BACT|nr:VacJ family lipoprotein [Paucidesulfovibrio gracilis]SKA97221.1 phospholipid-binding lipoprotein MlaA [Paucidesulfovibrio gracilis DSM 16080]
MKRSLTATLLLLALAFALSAVPAAASEEAQVMEVAQWEYDAGDEFSEAFDAQGNAPTAEGDVVDRTPDPFEGWNRFWFQFNDRLYFYLVKPVSQGYAYVIPERPRQWVENFFTNLMFPVRFVNCLLQGKLDSAGMETSKFIANTAFGLGGLADVASDMDPVRPTPPGDEDLGQTFGSWGIANGPYLVWPIIGPSTARDSVGYVGDHFITPTTYLHPWYWSVAAKAYEKVNFVSLRIGEYEGIKEGAIDPYVTFKSAYLRYREKKVSK